MMKQIVLQYRRYFNRCYNPGKQFNLVDPLKGSDLLFGGAISIDTFGGGNTGFSSLSQGIQL